MPSTTFVPPGQANQSPGEMRQRFPHSAAAAETGLSPVPYQSTSPDKRQQQILQSSLSHEQQQLHRFNNQGLPLPDTLVGNRHASWPQMLPPNSHLFNPVHTHETIAQQQQHQQHHQQQQFHPLHRRYSDAVMQDAATSSVRQDVAASHRRYSDAMMHDAPANMISFHQSEPSFPTWSLPSMEGGDQYPGMPGMSQQQQREHFYYPSGGCMMMGPPGYTSPSNFANYPQTNTSLNDPPAAANLMRRQRPKPIQRGDSSVAASAIVSRMSGALQDNEFPQYNDHDPFEPMPLPAEEGNYDNEGEPSQQPW